VRYSKKLDMLAATIFDWKFFNHHEEHENCMKWSGGDFDSEQFNAESVNRELMKYLRWSRDRYHSWGGIE